MAVGLAFGLGCGGATFEKGACQRPDLTGCPVEELRFEGAYGVDADDLATHLATAETRRTLFGAVVVDYETFDPAVLERDLERIERYYRARGYYEAHVRAARVTPRGDDGVAVEIAVDPGLPVLVGSVTLELAGVRPGPETFEVLGALKDVEAQAAEDAERGLARGKAFDEQNYDGLKRALIRAMANSGFAYADVEGRVDVDLATRTARIRLTPKLGPPCTFGAITVRGSSEVPEAAVRRAIGFDEGEPYSRSKLEQAEQSLAELSVFASVEVEPGLSPPGAPPTARIPVRFTVRPGKLRSVKLGVGATLGAELETHLVGGWEDRNFLGGLRRLSIEAKPGLVLYPTNLSYLHSPTDVLPEVQSRLEFRQPQLLDARTTGLARIAYNRFRVEQQSSAETVDVCYRDSRSGAAEVAPACTIVGYDEYVGTLGVERYFDDLFTSRRVKLGGEGQRRGRWLYLAELAHWQIDDPFSFNAAEPPPSYELVIIRHLETLAWLDLRKNADDLPDPFSPNKGAYLGMSFQYAGLGGDTKDVRLRPEARLYAPISRDVTLGFRAVLGLLFPENYGDSLDDATPAALRGDEQAFTRDMQLLSFRAFFSGGPYSNRGYPTNGIGPRAVVLDTSDNRKLIVSGGRTLWESSLELRFTLVEELAGGLLAGAVFADASDVTRGEGQLRLTHPHVSAGFGLRYDTPVGPLRADVGYRLPCLQITGSRTNAAGESVCSELPADPGTGIDTRPGVVDEGDPGDVFGLPIAFSIVFGEAF